MVLTLAVNGNSMKEVGRRLGISPRTAESHKYNALLMLGLCNKAALVEFALRQGLLGAPVTLTADEPAEPAAGASASERDSSPPPLLHAPEDQSGARIPGISLPAIGARAVAADPGASVFLVGTSAAMRGIFGQIARFAAYDAPVLITGENGTGKGTVARAIHDRSARAAGPFVSVSCATCDGPVPRAEPSEAGHHAQPAWSGSIGQAYGGTLFLDEIGDMPAPLQGELLRLLQDSESAPADGVALRRPDVRVIAATSLRPRSALVPGRVREELFYRLDVLRLDLPSLRERLDDVPLLADHVLRQIAVELGREVRAFAPVALELMQSYPWAGNVRELIAAIRRAVVLSDAPVVQPADLQLQMPQRAAPVVADLAAHPAAGTVAERDMVLKTLRENGLNISRTAHVLGRSRMTLYRMLARGGLAQHREFVVQDAAKPGVLVPPFAGDDPAITGGRR
jgi:DNA-binding NtrC family response regulator